MGRDGEGVGYDDAMRFDYMDYDDQDQDGLAGKTPIRPAGKDDWEGFTDADCGLMADGQCALAGSEDCDWECPHSHGPRYCGSNAWHLAHQNMPVEGCECSECIKASSGESDG